MRNLKLSSSTIEFLASIIVGDDNKRRSGPQLVNFFNGFGSKDSYPFQDSRLKYTIAKLGEYNDTCQIVKIIKEVFHPVHFKECGGNRQVVNNLAQFLRKDSYLLTLENSSLEELEILDVYSIGDEIVDGEGIERLNHHFISEQIKKAMNKLNQQDYDGAITNSRTLTETILEEIIRKSGNEIPKYDGDLIKLYKETKKILNLDPSQKDLSDTLKQILSGLNSIISGISGISNKMGDRHSRTYKPSKRHAKLAVNAALTFCTFLLESYENQVEKRCIKEPN